MDIEKYKSIALNMDTYKKLKELANSNFEMPQSMAKTASYYIQKGFKRFKENGNSRSTRA
jgi:hypothetical protein